jgi:hypothetical protein
MRCTSGSAVTITLPNNLPVNFNVMLIQAGAGQIAFSFATGATLVNCQSHTKTAGQHATALLLVTANSGGAATLDPAAEGQSRRACGRAYRVPQMGAGEKRNSEANFYLILAS